MNPQLLYQIALTLLPEIGPIKAKQLIAYHGTATAVFEANKYKLEKTPGIGQATATAIINGKATALATAEAELTHIEKNKTTTLWYQQDSFPKRLLHCNDAPLMLYYKGIADLNAPKSIAIVGTRQITDYGRLHTEKIIEALASFNPTIVSGLAYGVDIVAHKAALKYGLPTVGVVANGFDRMYPADHKKTIAELYNVGGVLTEYLHNAKADRENFPLRNRIVAGMTDATILIETAIKGGAMITASLANGYHRDVFALPGKIGAEFSQGCNYLIKTNQAILVENATDIANALNWPQEGIAKPKIQKQLFVDFSPTEQKIMDLLNKVDQAEIDLLCAQTELPQSQLATSLLNLELSGLIRCLPGKRYKLT
jgi:DNA processing protein